MSADLDAARRLADEAEAEAKRIVEKRKGGWKYERQHRDLAAIVDEQAATIRTLAAALEQAQAERDNLYASVENLAHVEINLISERDQLRDALEQARAERDNARAVLWIAQVERDANAELLAKVAGSIEAYPSDYALPGDLVSEIERALYPEPEA